MTGGKGKERGKGLCDENLDPDSISITLLLSSSPLQKHLES